MKDERGNVTMHVAASRGLLEMMAFLIRKGANIDIQDIYGNTPLLYAIDKNQVDAVELLIKNGANVHITDFRGNSPLHSACSQNNKVRKMLTIIIPTYKKSLRSLSLSILCLSHALIHDEYQEVCELLLRQGADPEAMDFGSQRPSDRTKSYPIQQMLERFIRNRKDEAESMTQKTVNWVGFGIGLGIGMGIALAKQQEVFAVRLREEEQRKKEEDERRRSEMEQRLKKGSKKEAPQVRRLLE